MESRDSLLKNIFYIILFIALAGMQLYWDFGDAFNN
jgi:hypothetical protein